MPKFWAKDYLSEALQEQRAMVERMSLAPPAHIEIVDCYSHKGEVDNIHYTMPWILISPDADYNLQAHIPSSLLGPVHSDLQSLTAVLPRYPGGAMGSLKSIRGHQGTTDFVTSGSEGVGGGVEGYGGDESGSESLFSDSDEKERGMASTSLTQEIDLAMERVMSSITSSPGLGGRGHITESGEEFFTENLKGWEMNISMPGMADYYLEELESPSHLSSLLSALPTVTDLAVRLKPKLISDPLLNPTSGTPYTYMHICRSDFIFRDSAPEEEEFPPINDNKPSTTARDMDHFPREEIEDITDPVLELHIASPLRPLLQSSPSDTSLLPPLPQLPSPDRDEGEEKEGGMNVKSEEELSVLVCKADEESQRRKDQQFSSPALEEVPRSTDFVKLNNADVSRDSEDSGIGHAVLESPCLPLSSSPALLPSSSLSAQLARLEPIPVSPHSPHKLVLLSPVSEERLLGHIQEGSRAFDSVLALTLPYTGSGSHLGAVWKSYKPLHMAEECCDVHPIHLTGDSELALPWDPLASSYHLMATVQRALVSLQCPLEPEDTGTGQSVDTTESFPKDGIVNTLGEELVDTALQMVEGGDLPSLSSAPPGYLKAKQIGSPRHVSNLRAGAMSGKKDGRSVQLLDLEGEGLSPLDMFIMLRSGTLSPEIARKPESGMQREEDKVKEPVLQTETDTSQDDHQSWVNSPTVHDVYLNRDYQMILSKVSHYGTPLMETLQVQGLNTDRGASFSNLDPDDIKFFLKQQQKRLVDSQGLREEGVLLQSCKLAACLYILVSYANDVTNINLATGIRRFSFLNEKYEELIGSSLDLAKQGLADIQLRSSEHSMHHPKLQAMVSIVDNWKTRIRKNAREKVVVVVGKDFSTVSGDILDFLKSISDLKSCVFSFACDSTTNQMYLEALEERFHYYDCLVVPVASITSTFPWEKVSLLVEYESLGSTLFPDGQRPVNLRLRQWAVLKTVQDISATSLARSGSSSCSSVLSFQYTLIASENITANTKLLQLLESRFNILLVSRDYESLRKKMGSSLSYADLIVDQTTGIIVHPLSLLSSDPGVHTVTTRAAALSLQYERLWILLYAESENSYPYGGSIPLNLARLHASVAHYCPRQDAYQVKIMCASGCEETAHLVRSLAAETRRQSEDVNEQYWSNREWIADDAETHEKFLLNFPCLNSFSAQLMLRGNSLGEILPLSAPQLQELFPWLPLKVLKFFTTMCHISFQPSLPAMPGHGVSQYWENSDSYVVEPAVANLDDSLQYYEDEDGYAPFTARHERDDQCHTYQTDELCPLPGGVVAPWSSEDHADLVGITAYPSIPCEYSDTRETDTAPAVESHTEFNSSFSLPNDHYSVQEKVRHVLGNSRAPDALLLPTNQLQSMTNPSTLSNDVPPRPTTSFPLLATTLRVPTQKEVRSSVLSKLSPGSHHATNMSREYYGNDPTPPKLLTSGMVRRTPSRQPIKSLDLGLSSTTRGPQPHFQANDRGAALHSESNYGQRRNSSFLESFPGRSSSDYSQRKRVEGLADLMEFHSRQSGTDGGTEGGILTSNVAIKALTVGSTRPRPKRPLSSSPVFDCKVPIHAVSPHNDRESSLYSSPNVNSGSFKLSPVRKRRLVYKRLPSSSDGQTKLAFE